MRHRVSCFIDLLFHPRSRISSFSSVSFLLHASGCGTAGCACTSRTERGLLVELPSGSAVLARPEGVPMTANVLWLRLSRIRIGRGRLCLLSRGNSDI